MAGRLPIERSPWIMDGVQGWVGEVDGMYFCLPSEENRIKFSNGTK